MERSAAALATRPLRDAFAMLPVVQMIGGDLSSP